MDDTATQIIETSFGKVIAKDFAQSLAVSAGILGGFIVVGLVVTQVKKMRATRLAKKNPPKEEN